MVEPHAPANLFLLFFVDIEKKKKKLKGEVGESDVVQGCFVDFFHDDS